MTMKSGALLSRVAAGEAVIAAAFGVLSRGLARSTASAASALLTDGGVCCDCNELAAGTGGAEGVLKSECDVRKVAAMRTPTAINATEVASARRRFATGREA